MPPRLPTYLLNPYQHHKATLLRQTGPFAAALFNPSLVNLSTLISLRRAYQTKQAETGVGGSQKSIPNRSEVVLLRHGKKICVNFMPLSKLTRGKRCGYWFRKSSVPSMTRTWRTKQHYRRTNCGLGTKLLQQRRRRQRWAHLESLEFTEFMLTSSALLLYPYSS